MNCFIHPDREAAGTCVGCGKFICAECAKTVQEKNYCPQCLQQGVPFQNSIATSPLAIISLVLSIVALPLLFCYGCGIVFSIAAVITGLIARHEIKQSGGRQSGGGMALAGVIIGLITTGLVLLAGVCYLVFIVVMLLIPTDTDYYSLLTGLRNIRFLI